MLIGFRFESCRDDGILILMTLKRGPDPRDTCRLLHLLHHFLPPYAMQVCSVLQGSLSIFEAKP